MKITFFLIFIFFIQCDSDSEDYASENEGNQEFVISPDNKNKVVWDNLVGM